MGNEVLSIRDLSAGYDGIAVQSQVSISVGSSCFVALLGPNGAGKTTILRALAGYAEWLTGDIDVCGVGLQRQRDAAQLVSRGVRFVWEQRNMFGSMTVDDNLKVAGRAPRSRSMDEIYQMFPEIARRRATLAKQLSGGERSMLTLGMALLGRPRLLVVDELCEGLQAKVIDRMVSVLTGLRDTECLSMLFVEQSASVLRSLADSAAIVSGGHTTSLLPIEDALEQYSDYEGGLSLVG